MADEFDLDLDLDQEQDRVNKVEQRIKTLSEKVKMTSQERDELAKAKESLEAEKANISKEVEFYKNFNTLTTKYQGASEYQDKIREKVMAGYDVEDATVAILAKEGKLNQSAPNLPKDFPAGGSATNTIKGEGDKPLGEMTQDEKRAALADREGDLYQIFNQQR